MQKLCHCSQQGRLEEKAEKEIGVGVGVGDGEPGKIHAGEESLTFDDLHGTRMINLLLSRVRGEHAIKDIRFSLEG